MSIRKIQPRLVCALLGASVMALPMRDACATSIDAIMAPYLVPYTSTAAANTVFSSFVSLQALLAAYPSPASIDTLLAPYRAANTASVVAAANAFLATLDATQLAETVYAYNLTNVETWSNLPGATRNGPTLGSTTTTTTSATAAAASGPPGGGGGNPPGGGGGSPPGGGGTTTASFVMSAAQRAAALALIQTAVSTPGYSTFAKIRAADDVIEATDSTQPWGSANYHVAMIGTPSTTQPWMLQISGHHLAYNITYNAKRVSATPMFIGTEPPNFSVLSDGTTVVAGMVDGSTEYFVDGKETATAPTGTVASEVAPIETQRAAAYTLLQAIQADSSVSSAAKLSESFDDVTMGINASSSGNNDTNYPFNSATETSELYPTGTTDRGVLFTRLSNIEKLDVVAAIAAWVNTQKDDVALNLFLNYISPTALAQTYVAYSPGEGGTADFSSFPNLKTSPLLTQGSYMRIDGPRVWIEAIVQEAVAYRNEGWVHYHTLWRDKTADYGACFTTGAQTSTC